MFTAFLSTAAGLHQRFTRSGKAQPTCTCKNSRPRILDVVMRSCLIPETSWLYHRSGRMRRSVRGPSDVMTFGALCDREYGFDYSEIKKRKGLAWYPRVTSSGAIEWDPNPLFYRQSKLDVRPPGDYSRLGITSGRPLYEQA